MATNQNPTPQLAALEAMIAKTCFCKLRESCDDKNSDVCLRHRNIYVEFMAEKQQKSSV